MNPTIYVVMRCFETGDYNEIVALFTTDQQAKECVVYFESLGHQLPLPIYEILAFQANVWRKEDE